MFWVARCLVSHNIVHVSLCQAERNVLTVRLGLVLVAKTFHLAYFRCSLMLKWTECCVQPGAQQPCGCHWFYFGFQGFGIQAALSCLLQIFCFPSFFQSCFLPLRDCCSDHIPEPWRVSRSVSSNKLTQKVHFFKLVAEKHFIIFLFTFTLTFVIVFVPLVTFIWWTICRKRQQGGIPGLQAPICLGIITNFQFFHKVDSVDFVESSQCFLDFMPNPAIHFFFPWLNTILQSDM